MDYDIIKLLGIKDSCIKVLEIKESSTTRTVTIEKELFAHFCPACGFRMYSKGRETRTVNHPVMQDGLKLTLKIIKRRWQCTNPDCRAIESDEFSFVDKYRRNTNISDLLIVNAFKDPCLSAREIARRYSVSDTHAITTFARYVDMPRRQLTEIISVDEVHLNISKKYKYALIIQDFETGEPLDMIPSRREEITEPYFSRMSFKERSRVKYIISDMYRPYLAYIDKYFPHAVSVIDAFHVIQLINRNFLNYIRLVIRRLDQRDRDIHERREQEFGRHLPFNHSRDYLILKKYNWMLLKNRSDLKIYPQPRFNKQFGRMMNTFDYINWIYSLDPAFKDMFNLKELYVAFNRKYAGMPKEARIALKDIITIYRHSEYKMFRDVSYTLEEFFEPIINSFILSERVSKDGRYQSRLSNGPMEALNRIPKDMKRIGRGYRNFEHIRNRFLFSQRKNATILATPRTLDEVYLKAVKNHRIEELD